MRVITLHDKELLLCCERLAKQICDSHFSPDLILGVKTGGEEIARIVNRVLGENKCKLEFCHPVRESTDNKKKYLKKYLKRLPVSILNILRILEAKFFFVKKSRKKFKRIELPNDIGDSKKILIIDDAVDSGASLFHIMHAIRVINPFADIKTAVITLTNRHAIIKPDFMIFNNNTLVRFPWSEDAK